MRRLTFENARGESIVFYLSPLVIESLSGIGEVGADLQSQRSPNQDGDTYIDTRLQPRFIDLEGSITVTDFERIREYRRTISRVCNPKLGMGIITLELDGDIKQIGATLDSGVTFFERRRNPFQPFLITWKCPNPYWQSIDQITEPLAAFVPKFTFPFSFPVKFGERGSEVTLYNDGDVPCPIEIEFNGPATQPIITNRTTGEFIRVDRELFEGDKLIINTAYGRDRMVVIDRGNGVIKNAWHYIDIWDSTLFFLDVGVNTIDYNALASGGQAVVNISYRKQYVGI
ncbi:phage tail family protein [Virgibacillus sp. C22-A2]|uniref:Phage tail family protein n=1 Tax=Virgibacillus tibetensis TaxID=3042313 RepID=A0ABU6KAP5_9BACI|nr:phage tail family protein [Virgibacillus sp. C22-A2]